ncbi:MULTISPECIES: hypothetical protein [unclassified Afipia]|uniref:hypothetical protein n=1 Tax=unclassified Afipia TaxID=2642050 RepID=UPI001268AB4C|nr:MULTISPECIES: hypothetical protein [unclassified Afipia]
MHTDSRSTMVEILKRVFVGLVVAFVAIVLGLFAYNFYLRSTAGDDPAPPVIYERSNRPSRA